MGRIVSLDVGTKTIGVATTDPLGLFARPVTTVARAGVRKDVGVLEALFEELEGVERVVVGLPLELDGTEERPARLARQIGDAVAEKTGLPVDYMDERFSSVEAERRLLEIDLSRKKRKQVIDQAAAIIILESWMRERDMEETR